MAILILSGSGNKPAVKTSLVTPAGDVVGKTIQITSPTTLSSSVDVTIAKGTSLEIKQGGVITVPTGRTLTINGSFSAGIYQAFNCVGTGRVVFGPGSIKEAYPQWWGFSTSETAANNAAALLATLTASYRVVIPEGEYTITGIVHPNRQNHIVGIGSVRAGNIIINTTSAIGWDFPIASGLSWKSTMENLRIVPADGTIGIQMNQQGIHMKDVIVIGGIIAVYTQWLQNIRWENCSFYATTYAWLMQPSVSGDVIWLNTFVNILCSSSNGGTGTGTATGLHIASVNDSFVRDNLFDHLTIENVTKSINIVSATPQSVAVSNIFEHFYTEDVSVQYVSEGGGDGLNYNTWINPRLIAVGGSGQNPTTPSEFDPISTFIRGENSRIETAVAFHSQIQFPEVPVLSVQANTLDRYIEGTFTPVVSGVGAGGTATYSLQSGKYTVIGNVVTFSIAVAWTGHTGTGQMYIGGLPLASATATALLVIPQNIASPAGTIINGLTAATESAIYLYSTAVETGAFATLAVDAAGTLYVSGAYLAN